MNEGEFFIDYIVKQLVEYPKDIVVTRTDDDRGVLISLTVNPADLGRVIGKRGAIAQSMRTLLRCLGMKNNIHYGLKIIDIRHPDNNNHNYGEEI